MRVNTLLKLVGAAILSALALFGCGDDGDDNSSPTYTVTVNNGGTGAFGGGTYSPGATVTIFAGTAPANHVFNNWTTESSGVFFLDADNSTTVFTMPANTVIVTANFVSSEPFTNGVRDMWLECYQARDENGNLIEYEICSGIAFRNGELFAYGQTSNMGNTWYEWAWEYGITYTTNDNQITIRYDESYYGTTFTRTYTYSVSDNGNTLRLTPTDDDFASTINYTRRSNLTFIPLPSEDFCYILPNWCGDWDDQELNKRNESAMPQTPFLNQQPLRALSKR